MKPAGNLKIGKRSIHYNLKLILLHTVINALALFLTAFLLPNIKINFVGYGTYVILGIALAILNVVVKPILQFLTLPLLFVSYGIVIIVINSVLLWLLSVFFDDIVVIDTLIAAFIGGALMGVLSLLFESLLGVTPPIVDDKAGETVEA
jgi:putative membrane protein